MDCLFVPELLFNCLRTMRDIIIEILLYALTVCYWVCTSPEVLLLWFFALPRIIVFLGQQSCRPDRTRLVIDIYPILEHVSLVFYHLLYAMAIFDFTFGMVAWIFDVAKTAAK